MYLVKNSDMVLFSTHSDLKKAVNAAIDLIDKFREPFFIDAVDEWNKTMWLEEASYLSSRMMDF